MLVHVPCRSDYAMRLLKNSEKTHSEISQPNHSSNVENVDEREDAGLHQVHLE